MLQNAEKPYPKPIIVQKIFFTYKDKDITYEKLSYYISQRAVSLQRFGIKQKEIVGIYLDHPDVILEIFFSCLLIGAIPVILPYSLKEYERDVQENIERLERGMVLVLEHHQKREIKCRKRRKCDKYNKIIITKKKTCFKVMV